MESSGSTMEWDVIVHHDKKIIEVITRGSADKSGSMAMAQVLAESMRRHRFTRGLIDHRNIAGVSGDVLDVYERPRLLRLIGLILGIRIAAVIDERYTEHFKFLETVSMNQGFQYMAFVDSGKALEWLLK